MSRALEVSGLEVIETSIPGCLRVRPRVHRDERGSFVKTFHRPSFLRAGLCADFAEEFYSVSGRGVIRGLHFQLPPHEQVKVVHCVGGTVLDVVVDLRVGSPAFGRHLAVELDAGRPEMLYIPVGLAHGFYARSESAALVYMASSVHAPEADAGIRWDSCGIPWPDAPARLSERDLAFPSFAEFRSPFVYRDDQPDLNPEPR